MLHFLVGTAVIVLPQGNLALLAAIGAVKGAGEKLHNDLETLSGWYMLHQRPAHTCAELLLQPQHGSTSFGISYS
jgi:hypothetical protein